MGYLNPDQKREYQRKWLSKRREEWFLNKACARCGSEDRLELDHIDPAQKITHNIWSWSKARQATELTKCQVLCHDCHWQKTVINKELARGETSGQSKLMEYQVIEAKRLYAQGTMNFDQLSRHFACSETTIRDAVRGKTWSHVSVV